MDYLRIEGCTALNFKLAKTTLQQENLFLHDANTFSL